MLDEQPGMIYVYVQVGFYSLNHIIGINKKSEGSKIEPCRTPHANFAFMLTQFATSTVK